MFVLNTIVTIFWQGKPFEGVRILRDIKGGRGLMPLSLSH